MTQTADELRAALAQEEMILAALREALTSNKMIYAHFEHGYDATVSRCAALSFAIAAAEAGE